jgi:hypothetical protein
MADAAYGFVPWVRRGVVSLARTAPTQNFVSLQVALTVNGAATSPVSVRMHGPGQVTGIDARAIIRSEPRPDSTTFEPNYFPAVEFATPDFPWLFTPALASAATLRPWLCVVVVREQPGVALTQRARALPLLEFSAPAVPLDELPDLEQIAMWAHAQIVGPAVSTDDQVRAALAGPASSRVSRIICPRRLEPDTRYLACLVPTYHAGVQAGVSPDLAADDTDVAPAWDASTQTPFALPVYWSWRFGTSAAGDFASLARKLRPPAQPLDVGLRPIDVSSPEFGMPPFAGLTLGLEGALRASQVTPTEWPAGVQAQFEQALRPILVPPPNPDPIVTPPVYGQVPSGSTVPADGQPPHWLRELNLDPRHRAAAGMGTEIVRADQEALMASAWDQFEALRRANQLLRQLQLARVVSESTRAKHLGALDGPGTFLQLTRPLHARVRLDLGSVATLDAHIEASRIATGAVSFAFRRLVRRRGPLGRRLYGAAAPVSKIVERLNEPVTSPRSVVMIANRVAPAGTVLLDSVSSQTATADLTSRAVAAAPGWAAAVSSSGSVARVAGSPNWHGDPESPFWLDHGGGAFPVAPDFPGDSDQYAQMESRFRAAAAQVTTYISEVTARVPDVPDKPPLASTLTATQSMTLASIDPRTTLVARARARLVLPESGDPLRPVVAAPGFPQPMSRALSAQRLLPGVERVPPETAALLVTNPRFIEAFMLGLNDEIRREFSWRQYPADQRATFFRCFWGASTDAGAADDIPPIASWDPGHLLGENMATHDAQVVLLLRGELLRRYPSAIVSAVQAEVGSDGVRRLGATELLPVFRGEIDPDMTFFGFPLTVDQATAGAGWYFVLAEHPTEPRFGLEPTVVSGTLSEWNDLAWPQVNVVHNHVSISPPPPVTSLENGTWGANSAQQAFITFRRPVRVGLHASALIG